MILRFWGSSTPARALSLCCYSLLIVQLVAWSCPRDDVDCRLERTAAKYSMNAAEQFVLDKAQPHAVAYSGGFEVFTEDKLQDLKADTSSYTALLNALDILESRFFKVSHGTWPEAIDWTAAVMSTHVSATLIAMTENPGLPSSDSPPSLLKACDHENLINRYFTQITSFYFGQNAFSLRTQAYDDMLWVVLGWLEAIKFINRRSELHYATSHLSLDQQQKSNHSWYGRQFIPQYAHRARLFYELASQGWDTSLCGGGMIWNPYVAPYKNAITNELFIAASVGMYLYFPGDDNPSPFSKLHEQETEELPPAKAHDVEYLDNAVEAYRWLKGSGMRNEQGLYVDGFHIKGWRGGKDGSNGTRKCDLRDEKVYTYNQGVLLSGLRGLWEATGLTEYLQEGHELIRNVITATGWEDRDTGRKYRWAGLGRNGVLEELCDWSGTCSQNGQTFKGIFFHHLTLFCSPLPEYRGSDTEGSGLSNHEAGQLHQKSCDEYSDWIRHNAFAAYITRNDDGVFGEWWGRPSRRREDDDDEETKNMERPPTNEGTDYRNDGVPRDNIWQLPRDDLMYKPDEYYAGVDDVRYHWRENDKMEERPRKRDINDRGRGRTVETQSGGLAVLRALWRLVELRREARR